MGIVCSSLGIGHKKSLEDTVALTAIIFPLSLSLSAIGREGGRDGWREGGREGPLLALHNHKIAVRARKLNLDDIAELQI